MQHYSLRQLEYLIACIDHRSIAKAAAALNVSQPTISVAINKLEEEFKVQLLLRHHSQGVSPTASATKILTAARHLLADASDLRQQALLTSETVAGEIRLGSFNTLSAAVLPNLISTLGDTHPGIKLDLHEATQDFLIEGLTQGRLDAALLYDIDLPQGLRLVSLTEREPYVALPENHPLAKQSKVSLRDLKDEPMILLDISPSRSYFLGLFEAVGLEPTISYSSPSLELVRGMVGRGLGYSILVTRPQGDVTYEGLPLVVRPLENKVAFSKIVLASPANLRPTRLITSLEQVAEKILATDNGRPS